MVKKQKGIKTRSKMRAHLSKMPRGPSNAHSVCQKPSLGDTRLRAAMVCARACCALQRFERMRYMITRQADRLTPAPQCTSVAAKLWGKGVGGGVQGREAHK